MHARLAIADSQALARRGGSNPLQVAFASTNHQAAIRHSFAQGRQLLSESRNLLAKQAMTRKKLRSFDATQLIERQLVKAPCRHLLSESSEAVNIVPHQHRIDSPPNSIMAIFTSQGCDIATQLFKESSLPAHLVVE